eukprot:GFKZ01015660.1.p1 GENE.GFKZ01015660.1~~GFKZ01015660.1.p1  ORF type:complete len:1167 (+),score=203.81 GFKZ01015660.1:298-3798(+)
MSSALSPGGYVRPTQRGAAPPRSVNVQVAVRCRPLNHREKTSGERTVLVCAEDRREVVCVAPASQRKVHSSAAPNPKKTYTYDHVFGPDATQQDVYRGVVESIVDEVLQGYNCTVFAYGQTGTGKTHTMEGRRDSEMVAIEERRIAENAGIIPRAVKQVFDHLRSITDEHSVRVSHLELYNEQLTDLLSPHDAGSDSLRMYEDPAKGTFVQGLEDIVVTNEEEIFAVLDKSALKRRTAETLMNKYSSRSHSVFSITIHIKESTPEGADLLKVGKLNLVDLAGSENVGRSGAIKGRAREAGNINQSLLTLGRVITALVDRHPHIPYRDSKLTRLLQESLGGRNKTCIIATVTPGSHSLEETASTLDYAYRAKSIKNRPTVNQMIAKHVLLKEYTEEILKLKKELDANRSKNGVYLPPEEYQKLQSIASQQKDTISELELRNEEFEKRTASLREKLETTQGALDREQAQLKNTQFVLEETKRHLSRTEKALSQVTQQKEENAYLVRNHVATEAALHQQGEELQDTVETCVSDIRVLHKRVASKSDLEKENLQNLSKLQENIGESIVAFRESAQAHERDQVALLKRSEVGVDQLSIRVDEGLSSITSRLEKYLKQFSEKEAEHELTNAKLMKGHSSDVQKGLEAFIEKTEEQKAAVISIEGAVTELAKMIAECVERTQDAFSEFQIFMSEHNASLRERQKDFTARLNHWCGDLRTDIGSHVKKQSSLCDKLKLSHHRQFEKQRKILRETQARVIAQVTTALQSFSADNEACIENTQNTTNTELQELLQTSTALEGSVVESSRQLETKFDVLVRDSVSQCEDLSALSDTTGATIEAQAQDTATHVVGMQTAVANVGRSTRNWYSEVRELTRTARVSHRQFQEKADSLRISQSSKREVELEAEISRIGEATGDVRNSTKVSAKELQSTMRENAGGVHKFVGDVTESLNSAVDRPVQMFEMAVDKEEDVVMRKVGDRKRLVRTRGHEILIRERRRERGDGDVEMEEFGHGGVEAQGLESPTKPGSITEELVDGSLGSESPTSSLTSTADTCATEEVAEKKNEPADGVELTETIRKENAEGNMQMKESRSVDSMERVVAVKKRAGETTEAVRSAVLVDTTNRRSRLRRRGLADESRLYIKPKSTKASGFLVRSSSARPSGIPIPKGSRRGLGL